MMNLFLATTQSYLVDACQLLASKHDGVYLGSYTYSKTKICAKPKINLLLNQLEVYEGLVFANLKQSYSFKPNPLHYELLKRSNSTAYSLSKVKLNKIALQVYNMWVYFFTTYEPTHIVFEDIPHQFADHVLYELCLEHNISVLGFSPVYGGLGTIVWSDYSKPGFCELENTQNYLDNNINLKALSAFKKSKYFDNKSSITSLLWDHAEFQLGVQPLIIIGKILSAFKYLARLTKYSKYYPSDIWLQNTFRLLLGYSEYNRELVYSCRTKERNKTYYNNISSDFSCPPHFVILYLQYMPEVSTCPCSFPFTNLADTIKTIVKNLPPNFKLLVKEHPSQFSASYTRYPEVWRSIEFYRNLDLHDQIKLVPLNIDSYQLAADSYCVFTFGGSIGADMINRGIHICSLGLSWYKSAIKNHCVRTMHELALYTRNVVRNKRLFIQESDNYSLHIYSILRQSVFCTIGGPNVVKHLNLSCNQNTLSFLRLMDCQLEL